MKSLLRPGILVALFIVLTFELGCGSGSGSGGSGRQPPAEHFAYVLYNNPIGSSASSKISVSDDSVVQTENAGVDSVSEVFSGANGGQLFIANRGDDSVTEYSLVGTPNPVKISLPGPVGLTSTTSSRVFTANLGGTPGCPNDTGSVSAIDTAALAVVSTTCASPAPFANPTAIAQLPDGGKLYVLTGNASISILDTSGSTVLSTIGPSIAHPWSPFAIAPSLDGSYVFVSDHGSVVPGGVWIITTSNDMLAGVAGGGHPYFSVLDPHLNRLYVAGQSLNTYTVSVLDASNVNVVNQNLPALSTLATLTMNAGSYPASVAALPDGTKFYVANAGSNDVTVFSASTFAELSTVPLGQLPLFIQSEPTSSKIYVATDTGVSIISTSTDTLTTTINSPPQDPTCTSTCTLQQPQMIITQ